MEEKDLNLNNEEQEQDQNNNDPEHKEEKQEKTFTQEEVNEIVKKRLKRELDEFKKQFKTDLEKEKSEADRLAKMTEEERKQEEWKKEKEEFENERKQFLKEKLEIQTMKELSQVGIPAEFSSFVMADTAEEINDRIKTFKSQWDKAIEEKVNEKLKGTTPKTSNKTGISSSITKEEFKKMTYPEKMKLKEKDPELFEQLFYN